VCRSARRVAALRAKLVVTPILLASFAALLLLIFDVIQAG